MLRLALGNGSPNPVACSVACRLIIDVYANNFNALRQRATALGGTLKYWLLNRATVEPDFCVIEFPTQFLIVIAGTTNANQVFGELVSQVVPGIDNEIPSAFPGIGSSCVAFFLEGLTGPTTLPGQTLRTAASVEERIAFAIGSPDVRKEIAIVGHSYGAAVGFMLARHCKARLARNAYVSLLTFGEPRSYNSAITPYEPDIHNRMVAVQAARGSSQGRRIDERQGVIYRDPVTLVPVALTPFRELAKLPARIAQAIGGTGILTTAVGNTGAPDDANAGGVARGGQAQRTPPGLHPNVLPGPSSASPTRRAVTDFFSDVGLALSTIDAIELGHFGVPWFIEERWIENASGFDLFLAVPFADIVGTLANADAFREHFIEDSYLNKCERWNIRIRDGVPNRPPVLRRPQMNWREIIAAAIEQARLAGELNSLSNIGGTPAVSGLTEVSGLLRSSASLNGFAAGLENLQDRVALNFTSSPTVLWKNAFPQAYGRVLRAISTARSQESSAAATVDAILANIVNGANSTDIGRLQATVVALTELANSQAAEIVYLQAVINGTAVGPPPGRYVTASEQYGLPAPTFPELPFFAGAIDPITGQPLGLTPLPDEPGRPSPPVMPGSSQPGLPAPPVPVPSVPYRRMPFIPGGGL